MPSDTPPLPSPELDGDFDPSVHLTPTKDATQQSTIVSSMKSCAIAYTLSIEDEDMDVRDSSSPNGSHGGGSFIREQSSPSFILSPQEGFSPPPLSGLFQRTIMDDDTIKDLFLPPGNAPSHSCSDGMARNTQVGLVASTSKPPASQRSSSYRDSQTSTESRGTNFSRGSHTASGSHTPSKRRRSRHVRSTFVLDGSFAFGTLSKPTSTFEEASTTQGTRAPEQQHRLSFSGSHSSKMPGHQQPYPGVQNGRIESSGITDFDKIPDEL
jgi:hypothetical protein